MRLAASVLPGRLPDHGPQVIGKGGELIFGQPPCLGRAPRSPLPLAWPRSLLTASAIGPGGGAWASGIPVRRYVYSASAVQGTGEGEAASSAGACQPSASPPA